MIQELSNKKRARTLSTMTSGFTLIEMIVAIFIFSVVMVVATGALVSIIDANRKAQAVESIMNSVAFSVDSMTRALRVGSGYVCGQVNCNISGSNSLTFTNVDGVEVEYSLNQSTKQIERTVDGGEALPLTAPNVTIERLAFYVDGTAVNDSEQPFVFLVVTGRAGEGRAETVFNLQTMVTQRILDR